MKQIQIEIKWAIIFVVMMIIWMWGEKMSGLHDVHIDKHMIYTNLIAIPAIATFVIALLDKRKNHYGGKMTYLQGFTSGMIITAFVTILSPLVQYLTSEVISPDYFENIIAYSVENNYLTQEAAEAQFNLESYIIMAPIGSLAMGTLTSLIVALFTRKR